MIAYSYVELRNGVATKLRYEPGESRERLQSFHEQGGWTITRDGDTLRITKPGDPGRDNGHDVEVPWASALCAIRAKEQPDAEPTDDKPKGKKP